MLRHDRSGQPAPGPERSAAAFIACAARPPPLHEGAGANAADLTGFSLNNSCIHQLTRIAPLTRHLGARYAANAINYS